jgi:hypothetical protein
MLLIARDPFAHLPQASEFRDSYLSRNSPNVEPPRADVFSGPTTSSDRHAAEQCDELASFQLVELHSMPANQAGLQDIELATISQRVSERLYKPVSRGRERLMSESGHTRSFGDVGSMSGLPESRYAAKHAFRPHFAGLCCRSRDVP